MFQDYVTYQLSVMENIGIGNVDEFDPTRRPSPRPQYEAGPTG